MVFNKFTFITYIYIWICFLVIHYVSNLFENTCPAMTKSTQCTEGVISGRSCLFLVRPLLGPPRPPHKPLSQVFFTSKPQIFHLYTIIKLTAQLFSLFSLVDKILKIHWPQFNCIFLCQGRALFFKSMFLCRANLKSSISRKIGLLQKHAYDVYKYR